MRSRPVAAALMGLVLAACSASPPVPSFQDATPPPVLEIPEPGRPYEAGDILAAMRDSRRPGGVPDELETQRVAEQIADAIWTIDGRPWSIISVGGSCGPDECVLDVAGSRSDGMGDDVWIFSVQPDPGGSVSVTEHHLGAVPTVLAEHADEVTRNAAVADDLEGLVLASASWLPPPDDGVLILAYRAGDEEGSCRRDARVDLGSGEVEIARPVDC